LITVSAIVVGTAARFRDVELRLTLLEPILMALMQLAAAPATEHGATTPTETSLVITAPMHPLAADLDGEVTVYKTPWRLTWGVPTAQAVTIATLVGRPRQQVIFAYPARAMMVGRRAPAKRLGFFLHDNTAANLTPDAIK